MSSAAGLRTDLRQSTVLVTELGLVVMSLIWGLNFAVLKYGTNVLAPYAYNALRMAVGTVALLALAAASAPRPPRAVVVRLMAFGVLGHGVYQALFITGLTMTRAGTAALVVAASPAVIAIIGRAMGVEVVNRRAVVGISMSFLGIAFVVFGSARGGDPGNERVLGDLLIFGSTIAWGFYTTLLRRDAVRIEGVQIAAWTLVGGTIPIVLMGLPQLAHAGWGAITPLTWGAIAYSGAGSLGVAYLFWYRGVRVIGSTRTAMFSQLQPLIALLGSWAMLAERPTRWQIIGSLAVMGGLLLTREDVAPEPAHGE